MGRDDRVYQVHGRYLIREDSPASTGCELRSGQQSLAALEEGPNGMHFLSRQVPSQSNVHVIGQR
jgi:hypothetical protein